MANVQELKTAADLDAMLAASQEAPIALLKHSIACPISARGQKEFVGLEEDGDPALYCVVVQYARELSGQIAERLGVRHETPQVLVVHDGEVIYHASHFDITTERVREAARQAA